jgi:hypothetical protein
VTFSLYACRFEFRALEATRFPSGSAANTFRGAFGHILRDIACRKECPGPKTCPRRRECAYARLFEPVWEGGPSGFADAPRPFVIRASALDGRSYQAGDRFPVDVHVFDLGEPLLEYLIRVFDRLAVEGIGTGRGRVALDRVYALTAGRRTGACVYQAGQSIAPASATLIELPLEDGAESTAHGALVRFLTPTELKAGGRVLEDAPFAAVFARARDRVSAICRLYGLAPLEMDFRAMAERAAAVECVNRDLKWIAARRRSSRTGQVHPLGGFVGEAQYAGNLAGFLPILRAAYWTGIGRQTVWGKGVIEVVPTLRGGGFINAPVRESSDR